MPETPGAVYNYRHWSVEVDEGKYRIAVSVKITVNNQRGEEYNELTVAENDFTRVKNIEARVIAADGREFYQRQKKDMQKLCGFGEYALYSDLCYYYAALEAPQFPYSIEYEYELESKSLFAWNPAVFQTDVPVEEAIYSLTIKKDFPFHYKMYGAEIEPEIQTVEGDKSLYTWAMRDIPPLQDEKYVPIEDDHPIRICFAAGFFELYNYKMEGFAWDDIARWYAEMAKNKYLKPDEAPKVNGKTDGRDLIRALYDKVTGNTRYVAVQIGLSGWQPHAADQTQDVGYGDCKDMATLLVSYLRNSGFEAKPCLVMTRDIGVTDVDFPSPDFNHVITMAVYDNDTIWMDPTCNLCPWGEIPYQIEGVNLLVIDSGQGTICRTPMAAADQNRKSRTTIIEVGPQNDVGMTSILEATGHVATSIRYALEGLTNDEKRRYINQLFPGAEKTFDITSFDIENLDSLYQPLKITIAAQWSKPARKIGDCLYVNPFVFNRLSKREAVMLNDRTLPLDLSYPDMISDSIVVKWDAGIQIDSLVLPPDESLVFDFGSVSVRSLVESDAAVIVFERAFDVPIIELEDFEDFKLMRDKISVIISSYVKIY